jgi:hypothetical protein
MTIAETIKRPVSFAAMLGLALAIFALPGAAWSGLRDDVRDFHAFLRDRPRVAAELGANPHLVNNRRYLERHDELALFIWRRPALRDELRYNPWRVLADYSGYNRYDRYDRYDRYGRYGRAGWWR